MVWCSADQTAVKLVGRMAEQTAASMVARLADEMAVRSVDERVGP